MCVYVYTGTKHGGECRRSSCIHIILAAEKKSLRDPSDNYARVVVFVCANNYARVVVGGAQC